MKALIVVLTILISSSQLFAQITETSTETKTVNRVFEKSNNIVVQYNDGSTKQLTNIQQDNNPQMPKDKSFVIFLRTPGGTLSSDDYFNGRRIEIKIVKIDLNTFEETIIVQGCRNSNDKADISYGNSSLYQFETLCNIGSVTLTPDGKRVYFTTTVSLTTLTIHYYSLDTKMILFFFNGGLLGLDYQGNVKVNEKGYKNGGGAYWQDWLLDSDGNKIKPLN